MIAVDTNILIYAHRIDSQWNKVATKVVRELAEGSMRWGLPFPCIGEFLSIVTNTRVYKEPTPVNKALKQIDSWLESPSCNLIGESVDSWSELKTLIEVGQIKGGAVHDARIYAVCLAEGVSSLYSADRDMTRMRGLKVVNPLI